ncbi:hypothetical protein CTI12_AA259680 [Artemisia annua]|uniref:Transmembrane protein n=1 Tax=Artemisia annua TaxID=35608 RepID=A0A2U1NJK2_ARTAN|nr:hypothetical protein CTI12_AA259680 [Artemisia annua]
MFGIEGVAFPKAFYPGLKHQTYTFFFFQNDLCISSFLKCKKKRFKGATERSFVIRSSRWMTICDHGRLSPHELCTGVEIVGSLAVEDEDNDTTGYGTVSLPHLLWQPGTVMLLSKRRTSILLIILVCTIFLSTWNLLNSVLSWYASATTITSSSSSFSWPAIYASMAVGMIFGLLSMAAALAIAVPASVVIWISILVLLTFCGKPRESVVVEGRRLTTEISRAMGMVVLKEGNLVAVVCAIFGYFLIQEMDSEVETLNVAIAAGFCNILVFRDTKDSCNTATSLALSCSATTDFVLTAVVATLLTQEFQEPMLNLRLRQQQVPQDALTHEVVDHVLKNQASTSSNGVQHGRQYSLGVQTAHDTEAWDASLVGADTEVGMQELPIPKHMDMFHLTTKN